jgi:hypothetical protein
MKQEILDLLHSNIAERSVGASTARGMPKGTVATARAYLARLDLSRFSVTTEKAFQVLLDRRTQYLVKKLVNNHPAPKAQYWGRARKFLNIFLRDVLYNKYLRAAYKLDKIERWLEVPLDSHVAHGLRREAGGHELPRFTGLKGLHSHNNTRYQKFASSVAKKKDIQRRVHLDLLYWRRAAIAAKKKPKRKSKRPR